MARRGWLRCWSQCVRKPVRNSSILISLTLSNSGSYFFLGGLLLLLGGIGEWILGICSSTYYELTKILIPFSSGNTFPSTVFCLFGGFWFTFGATIVPGYGAYGLYSTTDAVADGLNEEQFYATFSFFLIAMGILCAVFTVASIRTNVVLFTILLLLVPCCKWTIPP
jgi:succinate-acetate transporter protein